MKLTTNVTPEMNGNIHFWAKHLGMGEANIRTAIRKKALKAELGPSNYNPALLAYNITGQAILDWRQHKTKAVPTSSRFYVDRTITPEEAAAVNATLKAAGFAFQLIRKTRTVVKVEDMVLSANEVESIDADSQLAALEQSQAQPGFFNR